MRFSNYYNHEGGNRNIYSRRNLLGMTMKEILERELELAYQYNTIGIPDDDELMNSQNAYQYDDNGVQRWISGQKTPEQMLAEQQAKQQEKQAQEAKAFNELNAMNSRTNNLQGFGTPLADNTPEPLNKHSQFDDIDTTTEISQVASDLNKFKQIMSEQYAKTERPRTKNGGVIFEENPNGGRDPKTGKKLPKLEAPTLESEYPYNYENEAEAEAEPTTFETDPMWSEIANDYLNPKRVAEREAVEKSQEEARLKAFEAALDRHYNLDKNGKPLPTGNEEPYLSYEELLGLEPLPTELDETRELYQIPEEVENKPLEATIIKDNILTPYNDEIDNNTNLSEEEKYAKKLEIAQILENSKANLKEIEKEHLKAQAKNYAGAALQIGSAAIPTFAGTKAVKTVEKIITPLTNKLIPKLGTQYSKLFKKSIAESVVSGSVGGLGNSMLNNETAGNAIKQDIGNNILVNSLNNLGGEKMKQLKMTKKLLNIKKDVLANNPRQQRKLQELANEYYEKYIENTIVKNPHIGKIKFNKLNNSFDLDSLNIVPNLKKQVSNGNKIISYINNKGIKKDSTNKNIINKYKNNTFEYNIEADKIKGNSFKGITSYEDIDKFLQELKRRRKY